MLYIHRAICISPQQTFGEINIQNLKESVDKLHAIEPKYEAIPPGLLRRMGKAVRIGVGAALPLIKESSALDGIIIGTANGGMEDCIKFLNQIIDYEEGLLTPGNFVQSTSNAIASQIGLMSANKNYNITHVHRGLAFENAVIDAMMFARESPAKKYLLGGVDEISAYNYNIDFLEGSYKKKPQSNATLFQSASPGTIAGEASAMFLVSGKKEDATAALSAILVTQTDNVNAVKNQLKNFLENNLATGEQIDSFVSGENGDNRLVEYYDACERVLADKTTVIRFKHMSGEFPTAPAFALWLASYLINKNEVPAHAVKNAGTPKPFKKILIYNNYKGIQHSFMLVSNA